MKNIILVGYMGSGKSTVGQLLAQRLNLDFYDLDLLIENNAQASIADIFKSQGEIYFRKLEHQQLANIIASENIILATGGGTPCYGNNMQMITKSGATSIYLKASIDTLAQRLTSTHNRPLLANTTDEDLKEFIAKHLFERSFFYNQANHTIPIDGKTPAEIADTIISLLT